MTQGQVLSMPVTKEYQEFVELMVDYTAFLGQMVRDENEKLVALSSRELPRIEHSISVSQANAKQLANFEAKRAAAQEKAGYSGLSFRQLIEQAPQGEQEKLWQLFTRFEGNVAEIRFFNDKSMAVARDGMIEVDPASVLPGLSGARPNNPYEKIREEQHEQSNILETKV